MSDPVPIPITAEIDLHSFAPNEVASIVEEYIQAAARAGFEVVRLVHGRGRGVQRGIVQSTLDRHPDVEAFWDDHDASLGATFAKLKLGLQIAETADRSR
jgi:DNA-nicking Smr family endonuclease